MNFAHFLCFVNIGKNFAFDFYYDEKPESVSTYRSDLHSFEDIPVASLIVEETRKTKEENCRMFNCFDVELCRKNGFKVYVYTTEDETNLSKASLDIISSIQKSPYYTERYEAACLKVLALETVDR